MESAIEQPRSRSVVLGWLACCVVPGLLLVDTAIASSFGWRLNEARGLIVVPLLAAMFVVVSVALLVFSTYRRWLARTSGKLFLASCGLLLGLGFGELVIAALAPRAPFHRRMPNMVYEFEPNSFALPGVFEAATMTINRQGLRGSELPALEQDDTYRMVCIGGGTTECCYLDDDETWPSLVSMHMKEHDFPCLLAAAAVAEYASGHHLRFLRTAGSLDQADCALVLVGGNDLLRTILQQPVSGATPPIWLRSGLADLVQEIWNVQLGHGLILDTTGEEISVMRWGRPIAEFDLEQAIERDLVEYSERIREMIAAARQRKFRIVFISQPCIWAEFLSSLGTSRLRWAREPTSPRQWQALEAGKLREALERYNHVVAAACKDEGVGFIDCSTMNGREEYFYADFHLNEAGCRRLAEIVGEFLREHGASLRESSRD